MSRFISYQATEIAQQIKNGVEAPKLDLRLAKIKPLHAQWLIRAFDNLRSRPKTVTDGWQMAGITQALIDKAQIFQKNRKHIVNPFISVTLVSYDCASSDDGEND